MRRVRRAGRDVLRWGVWWWRSPALAAARAVDRRTPAGLERFVLVNALAAGALAAVWADPRSGAAGVALAAGAAVVLAQLTLAGAAALLHATAAALGGRGSVAALRRALAPSSLLLPLAVVCRTVPGGRAAALGVALAGLVAAVQATRLVEGLRLRPACLAVGLALVLAAAVGLAGRLLV